MISREVTACVMPIMIGDSLGLTPVIGDSLGLTPGMAQVEALPTKRVNVVRGAAAPVITEGCGTTAVLRTRARGGPWSPTVPPAVPLPASPLGEGCGPGPGVLLL